MEESHDHKSLLPIIIGISVWMRPNVMSKEKRVTETVNREDRRECEVDGGVKAVLLQTK